MLKVLQTESQAVYRESQFSGGDVFFRIATDEQSKEPAAFEFRVGYSLPATALLGIEEFSELTKLITTAADKIRQYRQEAAASKWKEI